MSIPTRPDRKRTVRAPVIAAAAAAAAAAAVTGLAITSAASAGLNDASWLSGQSGQWTDPGNWSSNPFYPNDGAPPGVLYHAWINPSDASAPYTVSLNAPVGVQLLTVDSAPATLAHGGGTLSAATLARIARGTLEVGGGTFASANVTTLSAGGTLRVLGSGVARSGALFSRGNVSVGPGATLNVGTFDQTGGLSEFAGGAATLETSATQTGGTARLSAGSLTSRAYRLTGGASFEHLPGAEHVAFEGPSIGGGSSYVMSGGTLTAHHRFEVGVGGDGTFLLTGGIVPRPNVPLPFEIRANVIGGSDASGPGNGTLIIDGPQTQFVRVPGATIWRYNAIGAGPSSTGTVIVRNGATADLEWAQVGLGGTGTLRIESGAQVTAFSLNVGNSEQIWTGMPFPRLGRGTVTLDGATSRLEVVRQSTGTGGFVTVGAGTMGPGGVGAGTMLLNAGTLVILQGGLNVATFGTLRIDGANVSVRNFQNHGSTVFASGSFTTQTLDVFGGLLTVTPGADKTVYTTRFTGRMDLNDNSLIQDWNVGSLSPTPINATRNALRNGLNTGGQFGLFSTAAANNPGRALAYAEATDLFSTFPVTLGGYTIDNTTVLVLYSRFGDANIDGIVNLDDFNRLAANFGGSGKYWVQGDFNYDAVVNLNDFNALAANFGLSASGPELTPRDWWALMSAVPEPASASLFGVAASAAMCRRRSARNLRG